MAPKDELSPHERADLKKNETVDFLLSRLRAGGKIQRRTQLRLHIRRWLTAVQQHDEVPSRVPEFLFRVLINFVAPQEAKEIQNTQLPETSTASEQWLVKIRALMAGQADERLLRLLDRMPERIVRCDDLMPNQAESLEGLIEKPKQSQNSDRELRDMMRNNDRKGMRENPEVFHVTGTNAWTVRRSYWHVALATDSEGSRLLEDEDLDRVLPGWRYIVDGEKVATLEDPMPAGPSRGWPDAERRNARRHQEPFSQPSPALALPVSASETVSSEKGSSAFVPPLCASGHDRASSFGTEDDHEVEQRRLLCEIFTEIRGLKKMIADAVGGNGVSQGRRSDCKPEEG